MNSLRLRLALIAVAACIAVGSASAVIAAPAAPPNTGAPVAAAQEAAGGSDHRIEPMVLWTVVGVGIGAIALGVLYLFKRQVGGFPQHPTWVAPITIMQSKDSPGDADSHEATAPGDDHGHGAHPAAAH